MSLLVWHSFIFTLGTVLSRLSGVARDVVLTGIFGATSSSEAFLVANRIPNLFRDMLAEGALGSSFTKIYTSVAQKDETRAHVLLCDAFRFGWFLLIIISVLGITFSPLFVRSLTVATEQSGRPSDFIEQTIGLTRVMFPFLGFAILAALAGGVLQKRGRFFVTASSSAALNLGYIFGAVVLAEIFSRFLPASIDGFAERRILGLAVGVVLGGALHFLTQFYFIWKDLVKPRGWTFSSHILGPDLRRVFQLMIPASIGASAATINLMVNTNFATGLETGAVTWLTYSFRLLQLPVGLFAVAIGSVALPSLTRAASDTENPNRLSTELQNSCELVCWLMVPCMIFLMASNDASVTLLYQHGAYDARASHETSMALRAYAFGTVGYGLVKILSSFYYAIERTSFTMSVSLCTIGLNFLLNWWLVDRFGHLGLALTTSITLMANSCALIVGAWYWGIVWDFRHLLATGITLVIASFAALFFQLSISQYTLPYLHELFPMPLKFESLIEVSINMAGVTCIFAIAAMIRYKLTPTQLIKVVKGWRRGRK